jgi:enoyl-CoA hydratase/carnithine racemase
MTESVTLNRAGHVAEIRFSSPPHNFVSVGLLRQIADAAGEVDADPTIRCSVLSSEGKSFCAGADLAGSEEMSGSGSMDSISGLYAQAQRLLTRKKPMVAAVQGAAVGAGLGLALAADFRAIGPGARFACNFVRLGFHPGFALSYTLPHLLGPQRARWMMLSAERVKPEQAIDWGLAERLSDDPLANAHAMAEEIAANAPLALLAVRASCDRGLEDAVVAAMRYEHGQQSTLRQTEDYAEGVASVFERREAHFKGR